MVRIWVILLVFLNASGAIAQVVFEPPVSEKTGKPIGVHKGSVALEVLVLFINPENVNNYIDAYIEDYFNGQPHFNLGEGSSDIYASGSFGLVPIISVRTNLNLKIPLEYGSAGTTVYLDDNRKQFTMNRFSIGGLLEYYIPQKDDAAFFIGAAGLYNFVSFEGQSAGTPGFRVEFGYTLYRFKSDLEFLLRLDNITAKVAHDNLYEIDFTGVGFGLGIVF